jgi:hypothetical protein
MMLCKMKSDAVVWGLFAVYALEQSLDGTESFCIL